MMSQPNLGDDAGIRFVPLEPEPTLEQQVRALAATVEKLSADLKKLQAAHAALVDLVESSPLYGIEGRVLIR